MSAVPQCITGNDCNIHIKAFGPWGKSYHSGESQMEISETPSYLSQGRKSQTFGWDVRRPSLLAVLIISPLTLPAWALKKLDRMTVD